MAITEGTQPAAVTWMDAWTGAGKSTAAFVPEAGALLVALVSGNGDPFTPCTGTVSDSLGGTWTLLKRQNGANSSVGGCAEIWCADSPGASLTVKVVGDANTRTGGQLTVRTLIGAKPRAQQTGASNGALLDTGLIQISIAAGTGNKIYGAAFNWTNSTAMTVLGNTTAVTAFADSTNLDNWAAYKSTGDTAGTATYGYSDFIAGQIAGVEILADVAAGGILTARPGRRWRQRFRHRQRTPTPVAIPKQIPGLHLWLDASQITGLNNTDPVATWTDLSGFDNNATQATAGSRPLYRTNILNGLPAVRYDGIDDWLTVLGTDALAMTNNAAGVSVLAVANLSDALSASSRQIITFSTNTETNARMKFGQRNATTNFWDISGRKLDADTQQNLLGALNTQNNGQILTAVVDWANSNADIYRNGNSEATTSAWFTDGNTSATNSISVIVGAKHTGAAPAEFWVGDLHEILVYNRVITTIERQFLETYLTIKWLPLIVPGPELFRSQYTGFF
jgi:hypothetical protein